MTWARAVALSGTMGALAALARIPFAAIPNVQPASALVILAGSAFGMRVGVMTGVLLPLVSNAFLGHGPWTFAQMGAWGLMGAGAALLGRRPGRVLLVGYGVVAGLVYGVLMDGWLWLVSIRPLAWSGLVPVLARGLPFNIAHAAGNAVVLATVGPRLAVLLHRIDRRRHIEPWSGAVPEAATSEVALGTSSAP